MFEIPESKAATKDGQFRFRLAGKEMAVPLQQYLSLGQAAVLGAVDARRVMAGHFREEIAAEFDQELADMLMGLELHQFHAFMDAWADASDVNPGESTPSGD